jgi:lysophospholipase
MAYIRRLHTNLDCQVREPTPCPYRELSLCPGGAWFLSSFAGNNWPTISYLRDNLWGPAFQNSLLLPANLLSTGLLEYVDVTLDVISKEGAGYPVSIVDPYGRLLSYQLLQGPDGGVATDLSSLTTLSNFTNYNVPYPVITSLGALLADGQCAPPLNATQYEFAPYEFGSWDAGVSAFTQTKYLGSSLNNGQPVQSDTCTIRYDNLGYVLGTSSDVFPGACEVIPASNSSDAPLAEVLEGIVSFAKEPALTDLYGLYRNPFYNYSRSSLVEGDTELTLADGGLAGQSEFHNRPRAV